MKKFLSLFIASFFFLALRAQTGNAEQKVSAMLKSFYSSYVTACDKPPKIGEAEMARIKKQYCTNALLNKLKGLELDYDPFLNAQDCSAGSVKTLAIQKVAGDGAVFRVSYVAYDNQRVNVKLTIVKEKSVYKIDNIVGVN